ncbi:hypothetical protein HD595_000968 [Nonomuraea roseoviolacea subsp. carminata]|uniref:Uncharacterized protein n=1 Tax=Nonomuraea roseoviolacea subsp. carminata TaxID=160689 RepID=A0ABT1JSW9_9ACTN|nr:hypothetical protein [Nonomuraea roseoviolacea subsp. carminata]
MPVQSMRAQGMPHCVLGALGKVVRGWGVGVAYGDVRGVPDMGVGVRGVVVSSVGVPGGSRQRARVRGAGGSCRGGVRAAVRSGGVPCARVVRRVEGAGVGLRRVNSGVAGGARGALLGMYVGDVVGGCVVRGVRVRVAAFTGADRRGERRSGLRVVLREGGRPSSRSVLEGGYGAGAAAGRSREGAQPRLGHGPLVDQVLGTHVPERTAPPRSRNRANEVLGMRGRASRVAVENRPEAGLRAGFRAHRQAEHAGSHVHPDHRPHLDEL